MSIIKILSVNHYLNKIFSSSNDSSIFPDGDTLLHRAKDFGVSVEKVAEQGGKLVNKVLDNSYVLVEKKVPMPKWVFTSFAVLSAFILLR